MTGLLATIGGLALIGLGFLVKGAVAYFGKKGAEHVYENREQYKQKWEDRRKK